MKNTLNSEKAWKIDLSPLIVDQNRKILKPLCFYPTYVWMIKKPSHAIVPLKSEV